jgi:hypothetical protein
MEAWTEWLKMLTWLKLKYYLKKSWIWIKAHWGEELDDKKKKEIEALVKKNKKDPDEITRRLSEITGFEIHVE